MMTFGEVLARDGLAISRYPDKWKTAKKLATLNERTDDARLLPYWERVRLLYLELGGEYNHQLTPCAKPKEF